MEIPKHYDFDEVHDFLCRKAPIDTTREFSAWLTVEFQKAFNKGWQRSASQPNNAADQGNVGECWYCHAKHGTGYSCSTCGRVGR